MKEVLNYYMPVISKSDVLSRLGLKEGGYLVLSTHREENVDSEENFRDIFDSVNALAKKYDKPVIVSTHPRTRKRLEELNVANLDPRISFLKPLGFYDYVKLQQNAFCVVSDSGTVTEESSILNFPAVTIRQAHERPEGMDEGTLIMCGLKTERVLESVDIVVKHHSNDKRQFRLVQDYDVDNVSKKVLRIIVSYTDYINRTVWRMPD
jgi:UDP-N-acetylglucosamine 2-epimerase (non-hydrolysing)